MRRTEQEFKAEILRRSNAYRRKRAENRKKVIGVGICACLCIAVFSVLDPFGASSEAPAADMSMMDEMKLEYAGSQDNSAIGTNAEEAAPMEQDSGAGIVEEAPAAEPGEAGIKGEVSAVADVSVSILTAANSWPLKPEDAHTVCAYLEQYTWEEGVPCCKLDCKVAVNGKIYGYSFHCGVLYDAEVQQGLTLEESDRVILNEILKDYIPLESAEPALVTVICGSEEITLDAADSAVIMDYLLSVQWIPTAANCLCDYTLYVNGLTYRYHSDCGTIQDEYGQSLTLSDADKRIFNEIVGRCPMRID